MWTIPFVAVSCLALGLSFTLRERPQAEFRSKSAAGSGNDATRTSVSVYVARDQRAPEPVANEIERGDGLLFALVNAGAAPFEYLMLFGVDASHEIRWFYPAYVEEGTDPVSLTIEPQQRKFLLPDVVHHTFASGSLVIYALFEHRARRVSEVEAWLRSERYAPSRPPQPAGMLQRIAVVVRP